MTTRENRRLPITTPFKEGYPQNIAMGSTFNPELAYEKTKHIAGELNTMGVKQKYGEAVGAFIILQEGVKMQEADVRDFCRNKISRYKIPKYIFFVNEFPMTGSGKIQKFRLKDLGLQLCKEQGIEII